MNVRMPEAREKEIFRELVSALKPALGDRTVHATVADRHRVSLDTVREIERKGMARDWPPLD
jgi:hypothetical protein